MTSSDLKLESVMSVLLDAPLLWLPAELDALEEFSERMPQSEHSILAMLLTPESRNLPLFKNFVQHLSKKKYFGSV